MIYHFCCPNNVCSALNVLQSERPLTHVACHACLTEAEILPSGNQATVYRRLDGKLRGVKLAQPMIFEARKEAS